MGELWAHSAPTWLCLTPQVPAGTRLHFQLLKSKEKTPSDSFHSTGTTEVRAPCIGCVIKIAVTSLLVSLWSLSCLLTAVHKIVDNGTDVLNLPYSLWFTHCSSFLKHLLTGVGWLVWASASCMKVLQKLRNNKSLWILSYRARWKVSLKWNENTFNSTGVPQNQEINEWYYR